MHVLGKGLHDLVAFVMAKQSMIHKDADQLVANRFMQQRCDNGRIHTT